MRALTGFLLLALGFVLGWQFYAPDHTTSVDLVMLRERLMAQPAPEDDPAARLAFTGSSVLVGSGVAATGQTDRHVQRVRVAAKSDQIAPFTQKIIVAQSETSKAPAPRLATRDNVRKSFLRRLQGELQRVGCYDGKIDGVWGDQARQALLRFAAIRGASVDLHNPGTGTLAMVQTESGQVCSSFGRQPKTRIAGTQSDRKAPAGLVAGPQIARTADRALPPFSGRMTVGGPPLEHIEARSLTNPAATRSEPSSGYAYAQPKTDGAIIGTDGFIQQFGAPSAVGAFPGDAPPAVEKPRRRKAYSKRQRVRSIQRQAFGESF